MDVWSVALILIVLGILGLEAYTYFTERTTLSSYVVAFTQVWPLLPFIVGLIIGALAGHFWWPYVSS